LSEIRLNPEQQEVVDHNGHCLVVACPGSGKTRVIVVKISHILSSIPKSRVCAVTFTRDAANELKKRLVDSIGSEIVNKRTRVGTFHSLAIRQLRANGHIGKVATPAEQRIFLHRALAASESEMTFEEAAQLVEKVKASISSTPEQDSDLYQTYANLLKRAQVEDLYDVLKKSLTLMQQGVVSPYPVEYMLVDEFQDTDEIQLAWVLEHVKAGTRVTVVGDDDQSVYSFRRALGYQGMERFRVATGASLIALGTNYRSRSEILSAAEKLICHNEERIKKPLNAVRGEGGKVFSVRHSSRPQEAEAVIEAILPYVVPCQKDPWFTYTVPPGQWAVLARNRRTLDCIEEALHSRHIRYVRPPSESIWTRPPFVYFISLLRSIQTGSADGVEQTLHFSGFMHEHIEMVHEAMQPELWRLMEGQVPSLPGLPEDINKTLKNFCTRSTGWRRQARLGNYRLAILGIADWFVERISNPDERELFGTLAQSVCRLNGSLAQRVNTLTLPASSSDEDGPSGVSLMTMHGSKGLEFDNVWIIAAEDNVIPSPKNPVYDEERRLMYVGMTRAKEHLFMSSRVTEQPSPFVLEAGYDPRQNR